MLSELIRCARIALVSFSVVIGLSIAPSYSHPHLSVDSRVGVNNISSIKIGMTIKEAEAASGIKLIPEPVAEHIAKIYYRRWHPDRNVLSGVDFVVLCKDRRCHNEDISRIEISNHTIVTISGIKIGDAIDKVKSTYPNRIEDVCGMVDYTNIEALLDRPQVRAYNNYLFWFNILDNKVSSYRIGTSDSIYAIDNC